MIISCHKSRAWQQLGAGDLLSWAAPGTWQLEMSSQATSSSADGLAGTWRRPGRAKLECEVPGQLEISNWGCHARRQVPSADAGFRWLQESSGAETQIGRSPLTGQKKKSVQN